MNYVLVCLIAIIFGIIGSFLGIYMANKEMIRIVAKQPKHEEPKREAPKNISGISDPMESYSRYKAEDSKLYRPIKREVVNRLEIGDNNDSK